MPFNTCLLPLQVIDQVVQTCPIDCRRALYGNVVLSVSLSLIVPQAHKAKAAALSCCFASALLLPISVDLALVLSVTCVLPHRQSVVWMGEAIGRSNAAPFAHVYRCPWQLCLLPWTEEGLALIC